MVDQADSPVVLTLSDVTFLRHGENNGFCPIIWSGFLHSYIIADVWGSWSMMQSPPCLRSSPGSWSVPGAFPAFSFLTAATISEQRIAGSLQWWLGPKVGVLRQEESIVGWWLYSAFPYSNHVCFTSSGLERRTSGTAENYIKKYWRYEQTQTLYPTSYFMHTWLHFNVTYNISYGKLIWGNICKSLQITCQTSKMDQETVLFLKAI